MVLPFQPLICILFSGIGNSGFISIGNSYIDLRRSIRELESLFSGQWKNGMVPHIIFHSETEETYFPNYDFWNSNVNAGAPQHPKSSGITQPAVHGFILENLLDKFPADETLNAFVRTIFLKLSPVIASYIPTAIPNAKV